MTTKLCRSFSSGSRDGQCPNSTLDGTDFCQRHLAMFNAQEKLSKQPNRCGSDVAHDADVYIKRGLGIDDTARYNESVMQEVGEMPNGKTSRPLSLVPNLIDNAPRVGNKWGIRIGDEHYGLYTTIEEINNNGGVVGDVPDVYRRMAGDLPSRPTSSEQRAIDEAPYVKVQVPPVVDEDERTWAVSCTCHATESDKHFGTCPMSEVPEKVGKQLGELDWHTERSLAKGTVTRSDILAWHRQICEEARDLMVQKNKDYAADADPLRNFKLSAQAAGISMAQCALVYLAENAAKYRSFIENGGKSASRTEKLVDHIRDSINFNILLYAILIDEGYFAHEGKK